MAVLIAKTERKQIRLCMNSLIIEGGFVAGYDMQVEILRPRTRWVLTRSGKELISKLYRRDLSRLGRLRKSSLIITLLGVTVISVLTEAGDAIDILGWFLFLESLLLIFLGNFEDRLVRALPTLDKEELMEEIILELNSQVDLAFVPVTKAHADLVLGSIRQGNQIGRVDFSDRRGILMLWREDEYVSLPELSPTLLTDAEVSEIIRLVGCSRPSGSTDARREVLECDLGPILYPSQILEFITTSETRGVREKLVPLMMFWPFLLIYVGIIWLLLDFRSRLSLPYFLWLLELSLVFGWLMFRRMFARSENINY